MDIQDLALRRRSIRKFRPEPVSPQLLAQLVDTARLYPSGGNLQPLRFAIVTEPETAAAVFADLRWAMYLPDYSLQPQEQPTAYIILLRDDTVCRKCSYDVGAASTLLMLAAAEAGLASCPIGNFSSAKLSALLQLPQTLCPELVLAIGYPDQESHIVPLTDSVRYTQNVQGDFLVPKRSLQDVLYKMI